jgi:glycine/D-amino acid oxidase-like deaminating enzyme
VADPARSVAVVGGGVVGAAVAYALARRGVAAMVLEAEDDLALGASGTNSGILHTGFDSTPGTSPGSSPRRASSWSPSGLSRRPGAGRRPTDERWVEQDGDEILRAVVEAVAELLDDARGEVVACGLDHQGESVLSWDAESGAPLAPVVVWQDKRSQELLDRLAGERRRSAGAAVCRWTPTSRRASWRGCSSTTRPCSTSRSRRRTSARASAPARWAPVR